MKKMIVKEFVGHYMGVAANTLRKDFIARMSEKGLALNPTQFTLLAKLNRSDGLTQNDLAAYAVRDRASITRALDVLEKNNLVERQRSTTDRRANYIYISNQGRTLFEKAVPIVRELDKKAITGLSEKELYEFSRIVTKITENAGGYFEWMNEPT